MTLRSNICKLQTLKRKLIACSEIENCDVIYKLIQITSILPDMFIVVSFNSCFQIFISDILFFTLKNADYGELK